MAVGAIIEDGKILETTSQSSVKKAATSNGMDKDAFLQLLVAQMKYQDPLEPTSNTEYISQYATFSQVEQMQNMSATMELSRASSMVGQLVEVQSKDSNGETKSIQGKVEYVSYENNKAYVSIDGILYSADDVVAVVDQDYQDAYELAISFITALNKLPDIENLTIADQGNVETLTKIYNGMSSYQQSFIAKEYVEVLQEYAERMEILVKAAGVEGTDAEGTEKTDGTQDTENSEEVGKTEETENAEDTENPEKSENGTNGESGEA